MQCERRDVLGFGENMEKRIKKESMIMEYGIGTVRSSQVLSQSFLIQVQG